MRAKPPRAASLARFLSCSHLILAAFPRRELHVRLVFNHSLATFCIFPSLLTPSVLTYKANKRLGERQRNLQEEVSEQQMLYFQIFHSIKNEKQQSNRALLQMEFHNAEEMS